MAAVKVPHDSKQWSAFYPAIGNQGLALINICQWGMLEEGYMSGKEYHRDWRSLKCVKWFLHTGWLRRKKCSSQGRVAVTQKGVGYINHLRSTRVSGQPVTPLQVYNWWLIWTWLLEIRQNKLETVQLGWWYSQESMESCTTSASMVLTGKLITNCGNQPCIELRIVGLWAGGPGAGGNKLPVGSGGDDLVAFTKQKLLVTPATRQFDCQISMSTYTQQLWWKPPSSTYHPGIVVDGFNHIILLNLAMVLWFRFHQLLLCIFYEKA